MLNLSQKSGDLQWYLMNLLLDFSFHRILVKDLNQLIKNPILIEIQKTKKWQ